MIIIVILFFNSLNVIFKAHNQRRSSYIVIRFSFFAHAILFLRIIYDLNDVNVQAFNGYIVKWFNVDKI